MILLGISGGPDSMYLLHKISKKTKDIIVATVNYNIRKDSSKDVKIVEDYCIKNNIRFFIHKVAENICFTGNFEN